MSSERHIRASGRHVKTIEQIAKIMRMMTDAPPKREQLLRRLLLQRSRTEPQAALVDRLWDE